MRILRKHLATQEGGFKFLSQNAKFLGSWSTKTRSPGVKKAIEEMHSATRGLMGTRDAVITASNDLSQRVLSASNLPRSVPTQVINRRHASIQIRLDTQDTSGQERGRDGVVTKDAATDTIVPAATVAILKKPATDTCAKKKWGCANDAIDATASQGSTRPRPK